MCAMHMETGLGEARVFLRGVYLQACRQVEGGRGCCAGGDTAFPESPLPVKQVPEAAVRLPSVFIMCHASFCMRLFRDTGFCNHQGDRSSRRSGVTALDKCSRSGMIAARRREVG